MGLEKHFTRLATCQTTSYLDCRYRYAHSDTLCEGGLVDEALVLFSEMHCDSNTVPNVIVYTSLVNGFCNSGRLNEAKRVFDEMVSRGIFANVTTYTTLIHGHCLSF
ncbi:pentatricopeptide repeat-containing protein At1g64583, mitochondrial-like [Papaver somniferum]|uniref:pentatricopeptide repeat-containing protein At1g64583, mitochondrial-like n=1 Tax=Papaver somniferum TaxID=3469 RepID=UPI000E6FA961|nr:pentatricopeptide repeat-containing protein At1g64583, mitochondrial-like [Papaver somniferum]